MGTVRVNVKPPVGSENKEKDCNFIPMGRGEIVRVNLFGYQSVFKKNEISREICVNWARTDKIMFNNVAINPFADHGKELRKSIKNTFFSKIRDEEKLDERKVKENGYFCVWQDLLDNL